MAKKFKQKLELTSKYVGDHYIQQEKTLDLEYAKAQQTLKQLRDEMHAQLLEHKKKADSKLEILTYER